MSTEQHQLCVGGLTVEVVRKAIKNLHLGVYPPNGRVRVAVPLAVSDEAVRLAVIGKLGWIKRQRAALKPSHANPSAKWSAARATTSSGGGFGFASSRTAGPPK